MAVKRRQKDDNHGTLEDKSQGPLVSDKRREMVHRGDTAQMGYWTHYEQVITSNDNTSNVVTSNDYY